MNKVKNNQSCITCRYSEESYEDILGAGGQPETILVRRCPFVNDEKVKKWENIDVWPHLVYHSDDIRSS